MRNRLLVGMGLFCVVAGAPLVTAAAGPEGPRSMAGAVVEATKTVPAERFLSATSVTYRIDADPWNGVLPQDLPKSGAEGRAKRAQIGFGRNVPSAAQVVPLDALDWQMLADRSKAARIQISASEAVGLRVAYQVTGPADGYEIRFAGSGRDEVYLENARLANGAETTWSPVLEGSVATLEIRLLPGFEPAQFSLAIPRLSHLTAVGAAIPKVLNIGTSGSCNVDLACVSNPSTALLNIAKATAKMSFTDPATGGSYLCTGTLINSSSGANYFYAAAHCIDTQAAASTLNTYWFFDAVSCGSTALPPYQLLTGGANLVVTDPTMDVTLLELRSTPPSGAFRAGWNATVIPKGTVVVDVHHPNGDLKKFSQGTMLGYAQGPRPTAVSRALTISVTASSMFAGRTVQRKAAPAARACLLTTQPVVTTSCAAGSKAARRRAEVRTALIISRAWTSCSPNLRHTSRRRPSFPLLRPARRRWSSSTCRSPTTTS